MIKEFFSAIKRDIFAYLAILVTSIAVSYFAINLANQPTKEEVISIFLGSHSSTGNKLKEKLDCIKPDYLKTINVSAFSVENQRFQEFYSSIGYEIADIVIIPESKVDSKVCHTYYARLTDEDIATNYNNEEILDFAFDENNLFHYGIKIHSKGHDVSNGPIQYYENIENDEDYYVFIRKNSIHAGIYSKSNFDTATILIKEMILWE